MEEAKKELTEAEVIKQMKDLFQDNEDFMLAEQAIINNMIEFEYEGQKYRVRKASYADKQEANKRRIKRFMELLKDKTFLLEKDLRKLYKEREIDIDLLEKQILEFEQQKSVLRLKLGQAIKEGKGLPELEQFKKEILDLNSQSENLMTQKNQLLEFSIENQVTIDLYSYLIYAVSEKFDGASWVKVWSSMDEFMASSPALVTAITKYASLLIINDLYAKD